MVVKCRTERAERNWKNYFKGTKRHTDLWPWQPHNAIPRGLRRRALPWLPGCSLAILFYVIWGCQVKGRALSPIILRGDIEKVRLRVSGLRGDVGSHLVLSVWSCTIGFVTKVSNSHPKQLWRLQPTCLDS